MMKQTQFSKNNKGVTLIEVIAVVAVLGVVMAAVTGFMITGTKMSARVSDTAASSMKDETAVEYINRWILIHNATELTPVEQKNADGATEFYALAIHMKDKTVAMITVEDSMVVYQRYSTEDPTGQRQLQSTIELCPGKIDFKIVNNTVTYVLNDVKHVVHLRVAEQP
jgi:prepilin-type N-terminal cleavage/methylation domain-containing protein